MSWFYCTAACLIQYSLTSRRLYRHQTDLDLSWYHIITLLALSLGTVWWQCDESWSSACKHPVKSSPDAQETNITSVLNKQQSCWYQTVHIYGSQFIVSEMMTGGSVTKTYMNRYNVTFRCQIKHILQYDDVMRCVSVTHLTSLSFCKDEKQDLTRRSTGPDIPQKHSLDPKLKIQISF